MRGGLSGEYSSGVMLLEQRGDISGVLLLEGRTGLSGVLLLKRRTSLPNFKFLIASNSSSWALTSAAAAACCYKKEYRILKMKDIMLSTKLNSYEHCLFPSICNFQHF